MGQINDETILRNIAELWLNSRSLVLSGEKAPNFPDDAVSLINFATNDFNHGCYLEGILGNKTKDGIVRGG